MLPKPSVPSKEAFQGPAKVRARPFRGEEAVVAAPLDVLVTVAFFGLGPSGNRAEESVQVCKWLEEAGVDAIHVSIGSFFPHPRNPAGVDLPTEDLEKTYDNLI